MCGRFLLTTPAAALVELLGLDEAPTLSPRYNIAPTQPIGIVRARATGAGREWTSARWGLVPHWSKNPAQGPPLFNARSETAATKPAFRDPFRTRHCLIPASGFYEWKGTAGSRQPHLFRMRDGRPFAFAGLWDRWEQAIGGPPIESCTILTTEPNALLRAVYDRMPVILRPDDFDRWLASTAAPAKSLAPLLRPYPAEEMAEQPVSRRLNNARFDGPECLEPDAS